MMRFHRAFQDSVRALAALGALILAGCLGSSGGASRKPAPSAPIAYGGLRASPYGIVPYPSADEWDSYAKRMEEAFPGSVGSFVWILGTVNGNAGRQTCSLNFPLDRPISMVTDFPLDENEAFLSLCDRRGYSVWLQVESGDADPVELCRAVLERYRDHLSVRGFGLDVEWHRTAGTDGWGTAVSDDLARRLVAAARSVRPRYEVFLKHWDPRWMPPSEREGLVFANDSQGHESLESMTREFSRWAREFGPSPVLYQVGYEADRGLWGTFSDPVRELGVLLARDLPANRELSIVWVDFTLRSVMVDGDR